MVMNDKTDVSISDYSRWELPALEAHAKKASTWQIPKNELPGLSFPTVQELEAIRHAAHEEGIEQGIKLGQQQIADAVARLASVAEHLYAPIEQQDLQLQQVMSDLLIKVCRAVLKRELSLNSSQIQQVVQEALVLLPADSAQTVIYLNAQDLALVNEHKTALPGWRADWTLKVNQQLAPGGCVVDSAKTRIDASIEQRFYEAIAPFFISDNLSGDTAAPIFKDPLTEPSEFIADSDADDAVTT
jgi:flagellar assembly protein FliH